MIGGIKMKKVYLISWCDDNHDPFYWLNENSLSWGMNTIVKSIIDTAQKQGIGAYLRKQDYVPKFSQVEMDSIMGRV